ncbi:MAG: hypothetical protein RSA79_01510 [Oscillospiraceae bacterium]
MNKEKVVSQFKDLSKLSDVTAQDFIINRAIISVATMLLPSVDNLENQDTLAFLCGAKAFYDYILIENATGLDNVKVSQVSFSLDKKSRLTFANEILINAILLNKSLLIDNDFYFANIK